MTRAGRRRDAEFAELSARIADRWARTCEGAGLCHRIDTAGGTTITTPTVLGVALGDPLTLRVRLLPGQTPTDLTGAADRVAHGMAVAAVRVTPLHPGQVVVRLLLRDPLAAQLALTGGDDLLIGRCEDGSELRCAPVDLPHTICQGQTRSGKSTWLYGLLAQLAGRPDVRLGGVDPSGVSLRPLLGSRHGPIASGLADPDAAEKALADLVAEMDCRLWAMPADRDVTETTEDTPLIVVVLEEYPALLRATDAADPKQGRRVRAQVARLLAESAKVGFRVVLAAQRAEAAIVGAAERAQCGGRLTFRVDSADTVKLLHGDAADLAAAHTHAPPGVAIIDWPGLATTRLRGPYLGGYATYAQTITTTNTTHNS